ncbi:phosphoribosylformylglycinamidine synthase subunit PurQ [Candidatus Woesearchaeota archaeon]|nr:phosphoribosylformylglycinamidine synthase subunit PurQ [Candidatus Woesearchaeota archaeon]
MVTPKALVLTGYGINCDEETKFAFELAGGLADIVHVNNLIDIPKKLGDYQILAFPGGFSYGDDTGSGNALANRIRNHLFDEVKEFVEKDTLSIGICNGFQVMVNLGLLPGLNGDYGREVALVHNDSARYVDRWVDLGVDPESIWTKDISILSVPIAHGEGKFFAPDDVLEKLGDKDLVAASYIRGDMCEYLNLPGNPNGSLDDIAGITNESGRLLGMMPHPERALFFTQLPNWPLLKQEYKRRGESLPEHGPGLQVFENAINYFK